jgi:hypothetical protein
MMKPTRLTPTVRAVAKVLRFVLCRKMRSITLNSHPVWESTARMPALAPVVVRSRNMRVVSKARMSE